MNMITLLPQPAHGGDYDQFASFFYLKHYFGSKDSVFFQACHKGIEVVKPQFDNDNGFLKITERYTKNFYSFLQFISESYQDKDVYISLNFEFAFDLLDMFTKTSNLDERLKSLKHDLEIKLLLSHDREERTFPFAQDIALNKPNWVKMIVYVDNYLGEFNNETILDNLINLYYCNVSFIKGFYKLRDERHEMVDFFCNRFELMHQVLIIKPLFEKLIV